MITHLEGRLVEKTPTYIVIDCNGVGYWVNISLNTFSQLPDSERVKVYTYLQVKEDAHTLFGFFDKSERELFTLLISVSGVGAATARVMLSSLSPGQLRSAIINNEVRTIQSAKGIGAKTAQRIILDLREKVLKLSDDPTQPALPQGQPHKEEALAALEVLGYPRKTAEAVVGKILSQATEAVSVEQLIKQALKQL